MQAPDLHRRDVHVVFAQQGPDPSDETGFVLMFGEEKMAVHGDVDPEAVDEHDAGISLHERAGDLRRSDLHREK